MVTVGGPCLSVVIPAFNEEGVIGEVVREVQRSILARLGDAELILVDDCSTDATSHILAGLAEADERLRVERARVNRGHGASVLRGLELARGDWIFQLDSDGQFVVEEFWTLWHRRHEADLVLGVRRGRRDPRHRLLLSSLSRTAVSLVALRKLRDPNVPFRLLRRRAWEDLRPLVGPRALAPSLLTAAGAAVRGWRVLELPVSHRARPHGRSSLRRARLAVFSARVLGQLVHFRWRLARSPRRRQP